MGMLGGGASTGPHNDSDTGATADSHGAASDGQGDGHAAIAFVDMPDLIVNLQSSTPRLRYLKLRLSLEVAGASEAEAVKQLMPRVMDSFQLYLRALTLDEVQGAAGMQRLKEELTARVNLAVEPMTVSTLSGHRRVAPYGMAGGSPGELGRNHIDREDGSTVELVGCDSREVQPGDSLVIETPGGGGYGS